MPLNHRLMLRHRSIIETIIDQLKNISRSRAFAPSFSGQLLCQHLGWLDCLLPSTEEALARHRPQFAAPSLTRTQVIYSTQTRSSCCQVDAGVNGRTGEAI